VLITQMSLKMHRFIKPLLLVFAISLMGCASIPKEVVELSYTVGQDLEAIHSSYRNLIQDHFQSLRDQAVDFLENTWVPHYINDFIEEGELVKRARGSDPKKVLEDVQLWAEVAVEEIENKKRELIDPIDRDEKELLKLVDEAFSRLIRANATITAHLNSIRKVKEVQDEALKALELKELRDKINNELISASKRAEEALEKLK